MQRDKAYSQLAERARGHAFEETSALLKAQWQVLVGRYDELAEQARRISDEDKVTYDPIPWDKTRKEPRP